VWPPEAISELRIDRGRLSMIFRDEWVPFEPGGESLWRAEQEPSGRWRGPSGSV
jgi:hypothetical protein